jgi:hypothetical protein
MLSRHLLQLEVHEYHRNHFYDLRVPIWKKGLPELCHFPRPISESRLGIRQGSIAFLAISAQLAVQEIAGFMPSPIHYTLCCEHKAKTPSQQRASPTCPAADKYGFRRSPQGG